MWVMLSSPLMIGADVRTMALEFRQVWLNKGLLDVHRTEFAQQGQRVRGNASECQVVPTTMPKSFYFTLYVYHVCMSVSTGTIHVVPSNPIVTMPVLVVHVYSSHECMVVAGVSTRTRVELYLLPIALACY